MPIGAAIVDRRRAVLAAVGQRDDLGIVRQQILFHRMDFEIAEITAEGDMLIVVDALPAKHQDRVLVDLLAERGNGGAIDRLG